MSRVFVVGSGPSLAKTPINDMQGEDLFVMNKACKIWEALKFTVKPKYYFKMDYNYYDRHEWKEHVYWALENCEKLYLWEQFRTGYKVGHPNHDTMPDGLGNLEGYNVEWLNKCKEHSPYQAGNWKATNTWHLPKLCTAFGSMNPILQLCSMMYDEIYLIGCDLGYTKDKEANHAMTGYDTDLRDKSEQDLRNMTHIHKVAKRSSSVPIYNATIGGNLEVYERVDLLDVLNG